MLCYNALMAKKTKTPPTPDTILDTALGMADETGWDALAMLDLAERLRIMPAELNAVFADKNAIADAWFGRALAAMLEPLPKGLKETEARVRLEVLMGRWFEALAPHRAVTAEMLGAKMWVFHPHHWVPMIFDLSRLVQWWRDAAGMTAMGRRRQIEEVTLTLIFLATLRVWCRDDSEDQDHTRAFLARRLRNPLFG